MRADLFINEKTFAYNGTDSVSDVSLKLSSFSKLLNFVINKNEDVFYLINKIDFYNTCLFDSHKTLSDLLYCNNEEIDGVIRDSVELLKIIIVNLKNTELQYDQVIDSINDETKCNGLVVFKKIENYSIKNKKQIICTIEDWYSFHRDYLVICPLQTPDLFLSETKKYFDKLIIHPDNSSYLSKVYKTHLEQIVVYLGIMNDFLLKELFEKSEYENDFVGFLNYFKSKHKEIEDASFESNFGSKKKKINFQKKFVIDGKTEVFHCEPHLKMNKNDQGKVGKFCRIYFKVPKKDDKYVYIGFITDLL